MRSIIAAVSLAALTMIGCRGNGDGPSPSDKTAQAITAFSTVDSTPVRARNVVFLGTSLTAGLGVGADAAFPALIEQKIKDAGLPFHVTNAGISGETSAGGLRRIDWLLQSPVDVLVLELGANDGLRGMSVDSMKRNLDLILRKTRLVYPQAQIVVAGMEAPPSLGYEYTASFHNVFPDLAHKYDGAIVPFLLARVAGNPSLNQADGMHPNAAGHRILAENVWSVLEPILRRLATEPT